MPAGVSGMTDRSITALIEAMDQAYCFATCGDYEARCPSAVECRRSPDRNDMRAMAAALAALRARYLLLPKEEPGWDAAVKRAMQSWDQVSPSWDPKEAYASFLLKRMAAALRAAGGRDG